MATLFGEILSSLSFAAGKVLRLNAAGNAFETATSDYSMVGFSPALATPTDGQTLYWGLNTNAAASTSADQAAIYIPIAGTIVAAQVTTYSVTAGSNENWSMYLRLNNSTDTLIATVGQSANYRVWLNSSLSIAVSAGHRIEVKEVCPTWGTDPATVRKHLWFLVRPS